MAVSYEERWRRYGLQGRLGMSREALGKLTTLPWLKPETRAEARRVYSAYCALTKTVYEETRATTAPKKKKDSSDG